MSFWRSIFSFKSMLEFLNWFYVILFYVILCSMGPRFLNLNLKHTILCPWIKWVSIGNFFPIILGNHAHLYPKNCEIGTGRDGVTPFHSVALSQLSGWVLRPQAIRGSRSSHAHFPAKSDPKYQ